MDFKNALEILTTKFNQYKAYRESNKDFTNPPAFVLALGGASGPGYINAILDCMLGGVKNPDGSFGLVEYTPERYKQKCIWFCLSMDSYYDQTDLYIQRWVAMNKKINSSPYKPSTAEDVIKIQDRYATLRKRVEETSMSTNVKDTLLERIFAKEKESIDAVIQSVHEPLSIIPLTKLSRYDGQITNNIFTDGKVIIGPHASYIPQYEGGWDAYKNQLIPNFYNVFCVMENYKKTSLDDLSLSKHRALRTRPLGTEQPMVDIVIGSKCSLDRSPMKQFQTICEEIIAMGGFCFVLNDAYFHMKGSMMNRNTGEEKRVNYLENYYFENMCDIPMFFQQFPNDRVFRIESNNDGDTTVLPLLRSIPTDGRLRGYMKNYHSYGGKRRGKHRKIARTIKYKKNRLYRKRQTRKL